MCKKERAMTPLCLHLCELKHKKMKKYLIALCLCLPMATYAEGGQDETLEGGLLTSKLNAKLEKAMDSTPSDDAKPEVGRRITDYVSAPVFGAYAVGKYGYTSDQTAEVNNSFEARLIRAYVSGFILKDFKYRIQIELKSPAMRDFTLEWLRFKEVQVKVGQFKRCFTYENPMNPWDVGFGAYSQVTQHMAAFGKEDPSGEASQNGRDLGIQLQGDLLPIGKDKHRLIRYQAGIFNGAGQNKKDNDSQKDFIGNIQFQPIQGLYVGLFGWTGSFTGDNNVHVHRNRWALGATYERDEWTVRTEYAHHSGHNWKDYDSDIHIFDGPDRADGWYAAVGIPCTKWLKVWAKYDAYREDATWGTLRTVYSVAPNINLHKHLMFQMQYNYIHDKTSSDRNQHEFWTQFYVRF